MVAAAIIGGAAISGIAGAVGSSSAAGAQSNAANRAAQTNLQMYNTTRGDLLPYNQLGQSSLGQLSAAANAQAPSTLTPFDPTQSWLEQTPGYKFQLYQGLKSTQNSAAARGLGLSGAALKANDTYAQGLASSNYQNQFNNYLNSQQQAYNQQVSNQTNTFNRLSALGSLGENAAAQTGSYGTQAAANIGQAQIGVGNAQAAGSLGVANSLGNIGSGISNAYLTNALLGGSGLFGGGGGGGGIVFV